MLAIVVATVCLGTVGGVGAQANGDGPSVSVEDPDVEVGETATVAVRLSATPNGLSGFNLEVRAVNGAVVITNGSVNENLELTTANVSADGRSIAFEGVDLSKRIEPGAGSVRLATVTVRGESDAEADLEVAVGSIDNDDGESMGLGDESNAAGQGANGQSGGGSVEQTAFTAVVAVVVFGVLLLAAVGVLQLVR